MTFIGHSTFLIQTIDGNILLDPMYSKCAGPMNLIGPRRVRQPGVSFDDLPDISIVLVSHNHYDHCDLPTLRALERRFHPLFVTPLRNAALLQSAGLLRVQELNWWGEHHDLDVWRSTHTGAAFLSSRPVRPQSSVVGRLRHLHPHPPYLLRRRHRVWASLPRDSQALGAH